MHGRNLTNASPPDRGTKRKTGNSIASWSPISPAPAEMTACRSRRFPRPSSRRRGSMTYGDPFDAVLSLQQALDSIRDSDWLETGTSGGGGYPPINVFRKGEDLVAVAEVPGIDKKD